MRHAGDLSAQMLSREEFPRTWQAIDSAMAGQVAPGLVAGLWDSREPDRILLASAGHRRLTPSPLAMGAETVFDLASLTKVYATATLAALFVDRRWVKWETPLAAILPEFRFSNSITLRHLLSHTAGFAAWAPYWESIRAQLHPRPVHEISVQERQSLMRDLVLSTPPEALPGQRALYSDLSFLLLGFALEELARTPLDRAIEKLLWQPLGASASRFFRVDRSPEKGRDESVAATEDCPWRGSVLQGQVHDDNCWAMGGYGGHAGAFGTARDLLHFSSRMLGGFLSSATIREAWSPVAVPPGCDRTPGWDTPSGEAPAAGRLFSRRSIGHLGFTGTSLWIDPEAGLAVTLLTNRVHPSRENVKIRAFRPAFHDAIRADLGH